MRHASRRFTKSRSTGDRHIPRSSLEPASMRCTHEGKPTRSSLTFQLKLQVGILSSLFVAAYSVTSRSGHYRGPAPFIPLASICSLRPTLVPHRPLATPPLANLRACARSHLRQMRLELRSDFRSCSLIHTIRHTEHRHISRGFADLLAYPCKRVTQG